MRFIVLKSVVLNVFEIIDLTEGHRVGSWFYRKSEAENYANELNDLN